jgi:hypothetical protein
MKLRFIFLVSLASVAVAHDEKKYDLLRSGRTLQGEMGEMDGGGAETLPGEGMVDNELPELPPCEEFKQDCSACAAAGYCAFSPDVGKDGSCLPNCDTAPADGACYSPPNFDDMTCKELSTDCEKDFDTCMGCLGSGLCAYSPDTGKDGSCLSSCDDADADADGRCFEKGSGDDFCAKIDTEEPTESPTDAPTIFVEPTESPTPEPTTALPTPFPTFAATPEPSDTIPVSEPTEMPVTDEPTTVEPSPLPTTMEPTASPTETAIDPTPLPSPEPTHVAELTCINTGGKIGKDDCCLFVDDFVSVPIMCLLLSFSLWGG